jgi:hypothetical protein
MKGVLVIVLSFSLVHSSVAFATGSLLESARRATRELAQTEPDPQKAAEAKRIVTLLGVGGLVAVVLTYGRTVRGQIQAIYDDRFVLLRDVDFPMEIPYGEVEKIDLGVKAVETRPTVAETSPAWTTADWVVWAVVVVGLCALAMALPGDPDEDDHNVGF